MENYPEFIVGRQELIQLPLLNIPAIRAKVDTGAKTSSIHAYDIEYYTEKGAPHVRFVVHPVEQNDTIACICTAPLTDKRIIKSSNGEKERRPVIETQITINDRSWPIELNLTNRDYMGFRMLIGRETLGKDMLVYPGVAYIHGKIKDAQLAALYE